MEHSHQEPRKKNPNPRYRQTYLTQRSIKGIVIFSAHFSYPNEYIQFNENSEFFHEIVCIWLTHAILIQEHRIIS